MIRHAIPFLAALALALPAAAQTTDAAPADGAGAASPGDAMTAVERWQAAPETVFDASEVDLADFVWVARPIVIFADSPQNPAFTQQMDLIRARQGELAIRDVLLVTDTDPGDPSAIRQQLRPRGFSITLIGKDGGVQLRKPFPWDVRELTRSIDKMPMRRQEMRARRDGDGSG